MFLLLIAATAVIALVAAAVMITRTRSRGRRDQLARQTAAARARAAAQAAERRRRRALDDEDNQLTSVIPAIRLPWPTQLSAPREPGLRDLDGEYPQFSAVSPFQTAPADAAPPFPGGAPGAPWPPAGRGQPDRWEDGRLVPPPRPEPAGPAQYPAQYPVEYPAAPAAWDECPRPVPAQDARMAPAPVPAEHAAALERARRRPAHGSHRGGHARRRRG